MRWKFTLPELQEKLDHLADRGVLPINAQDYERLFGTNDVAVTCLGSFARGHARLGGNSDALPLLVGLDKAPEVENPVRDGYSTHGQRGAA
jgi:hypothetical protein